MEEIKEPSPKRFKPTNTSEKLFTFQLLQATLPTLKHSIASLCDSEFNPSGLGSIKVTPENGVEIVVENSQTQVTGLLVLVVNGLHNFHCKKPISNYMINLNQVFEILFYDLECDATHIEVFLVDGSIKISFLFCGSSAPFKEFHVDLLQMDVGHQHKEFPQNKFFGFTVIPTEVLRQMIKRIEEIGRHQLVSVEITDALVTIFIGLLNPWLIRYPDNELINIRKYAAGLKQHGWFQLHHLNSLKKASYSALYLNLYLLKEPSNSILMLFKLGKLGDLLFRNNAIKLSTHRKTCENRNGTAAVRHWFRSSNSSFVHLQ